MDEEITDSLLQGIKEWIDLPQDSLLLSAGEKDSSFVNAFLRQKTVDNSISFTFPGNKRLLSSDSDCRIAKRQCSHKKINLPEKPAKYYAEKIVNAMNEYDYIFLLSTLKKMCDPAVKVSKSIYVIPPPFSYDEQPAPLQRSHFSSLEAFCAYLAAWNIFFPDGIFEASGHRVVVDTLPTFVFISLFSFTGHHFTKHVDFLRLPLQNYHPNFHENLAIIKTLLYRNDLVYANFTGSLVIFVNQDGFITELELYLTESK